MRTVQTYTDPCRWMLPDPLTGVRIPHVATMQTEHDPKSGVTVFRVTLMPVPENTNRRKEDR